MPPVAPQQLYKGPNNDLKCKTDHCKRHNNNYYYIIYTPLKVQVYKDS